MLSADTACAYESMHAGIQRLRDANIVCIYVYECMYVCMCSMYICMYVCVYVYASAAIEYRNGSECVDEVSAFTP